MGQTPATIPDEQRPERPVLIYDGECPFCIKQVTRMRRRSGDAVEYLPYQDSAGRFPALDQGELAESVHLVEPSGRVSAGAEAALRILTLVGVPRHTLWLYERVPGMAYLAEATYRFVARHRHRF